MDDPAYHALREQIEGLLTETRQHSRAAAEWDKVETYWHIGDAVDAHLSAHPGSTYGRQIVLSLSNDLQLARSTLYEILRFRRVVADPKVYAGGLFGWSHFRTLLRLPTTAQFDHWARLAADSGWTTRQLKRALETGVDADGLVAATAPATSALRPTFGEPATYRVVADRLTDQGAPAIDFGFHQVWVPDDRLAGFAAAPGDLVTLQPDAAGGLRARLRLDTPRLWTYAARTLHVVDGDTVDVVVDLGLGYRAFPRLRLRGLDTPELYTQAGRDAKAFVEQALAPCPMVVVTTRKTDAYGRYLADLAYLPGAADPARILRDGTYLNGELLRRKLAVRYLE